MERTAANHRQQSKAEKRNIIKYFKRAATFSIPGRPYSPGHDRGFSGPIVPLVPAAARRQKGGRGKGFNDVREPKSPKVSCMGQVKKHKDDRWRLASMRGDVCHRKEEDDNNEKENKKKKPSSSSSVLSMILKGKFCRDEKAGLQLPSSPAVAPAVLQAPSIGKMKKFASGRDKLGGFDWKDAGIHGEDENSADEREAEEEGEKADGVSHSEQRKEVNLWKRRAIRPVAQLRIS